MLALVGTVPHRDFPLVDSEVSLHDDEVCIQGCLLYTSPSPRDGLLSRMPSSA